MLTNRDRQYLRAIFRLRGSTRYVGPQELATDMGVTKVCAFQKMRRLEALGLGEYTIRKGLMLNREGAEMVEEEIRKHHLLEKFLKEQEATEEVRRRSFDDGYAVIEITSTANAQSLADTLAISEFDGFTLNIGAVSVNTIEVSIGSK